MCACDCYADCSKSLQLGLLWYMLVARSCKEHTGAVFKAARSRYCTGLRYSCSGETQHLLMEVQCSDV